MDRDLLISYSFCCDGEYQKILDCVKNKTKVDLVHVDNAITIFDDIYPKRLLELKYPPFVLYFNGDISLINLDNTIGIVGSRNACQYALNATRDLVNNNKDKIVVSGLAKGIDCQAHKYANKTIGVLGCGIDYVYPKCNYELIKNIEKQGLVLSEYPGLTKPLAYHFPFRNRIIAGLSNKIYIMQSSIKSGTMTTINEALELGKEIRVLPYNVYDVNGINNNHLIQEGAMIIENEEIAF